MRRQVGLTGIEILIVLAISAILLALAVPNFAPLLERHRTTGAANDLVRAFALARSQALATGERVVLAPLGTGWTSGWRVYVDSNNSASFDAGETEVQVFPALPANMTAAASANFAAGFVSFNAQGFPRGTNGTTFTDGDMLLTMGSTARRVCLDARGRTTVVSGSGTCP